MVQTFECAESLTRRSLLRGASAILTFAALPQLSLAAEPSKGRLLVILLRGGMDGLFAMPPVGDPTLVGRRKHLLPDGAFKLDATFSLHPALRNIQSLFSQGQALLVHAASNPYTGRSHFEGQDIMESGAEIAYSSGSGWLGRALEVSGYKAVTMSLPIPLILRGKNAPDTRFPTWISNPPASLYGQLEQLWAADNDLATYGQQLAAPQGYASMGGPSAGQDPQLSVLAREAGTRFRDPNGPRVAVLDHVGFDTHASQPGQHSRKLRDVDDAIGSFTSAVGSEIWKDTLVVTVTEFGRTVAENGSYGTDHGWGTCVFVLGGALKKSGIVADWPGLKAANLYEGRDLKATIDSRSLYGAILTASLGIDPDLVQKSVLQYPKDDRFSAYFS